MNTVEVLQLIRRFREAPPRPREQRCATAAAAEALLLGGDMAIDVEHAGEPASNAGLDSVELLEAGNQRVPVAGFGEPGHGVLDVGSRQDLVPSDKRQDQDEKGAWRQSDRSALSPSYVREQRGLRRSSSSDDEDEEEDNGHEKTAGSRLPAWTRVLPQSDDWSVLREVKGGKHDAAGRSKKHQRTYEELKRLLAKRRTAPAGSQLRDLMTPGEKDSASGMSSLLVARSEVRSILRPDGGIVLDLHLCGC
jgi:hypothetical protein